MKRSFLARLGGALALLLLLSAFSGSEVAEVCGTALDISGRYIEADLDFAGTRRRGARRLVFVERSTGEWTLWVTLDHYDSFVRVDPR